MSVLRRKAQAGKQEHQARSMTVPKSLRVGLAKTGDELFDIALVVIGATHEQCEHASLLGEIDENDLLTLIDGPNGTIGGAVLGAALVSALVQQQTTGRVSTPVDEVRKLTATDASLCAPLLDSLFEIAHGLLEMEQDRCLLGPYTFGARAENKRLFEFALEEPDYHVLRLTIDVASGVLQSTLTLILPIPKAAEVRSPDLSDGTLAPTLPAVTLEQTVMGLKAELSAILCEISVPLDKVSTFREGDVLTVPLEAFDDVRLMSFGQTRLASGALGQVDGQRALMITDPLSRGTGHEGLANHTLETKPDVEEISLPTELLDVEKHHMASSERVMKDGEGDLPELPDLSELPDVEASPTHSAQPGLPDLPDLPDLAEDLPTLNIA